MGTDISMNVEIKENGTWRILTTPAKNLGHTVADIYNISDQESIEIYYDTRNYDVFAILADMRNPTGKTLHNQSYDTISEARGWPEDISPGLRDENIDVMASWLLLSEILQFDWYGKVMHYEAMVDARIAHLFADHKPFPPPEQWPPDLETMHAIYLLDGVTVRWTDTYAVVASDFLEFIEGLKQYGDPSQIRLVFYFW